MPLKNDDYDGEFDFSSTDGESSDEKEEAATGRGTGIGVGGGGGGDSRAVKEFEVDEEEEEWKHEYWEEEKTISAIPFNNAVYFNKEINENRLIISFINNTTSTSIL